MEDIGPCLRNTDLLFVNDSEAKMLTGSDEPREATRIFRRHGAKDVVIKVGPRGCIIFADDQEHHVPGFAVTAKDTTGAGDCFVGAFLTAVHRGLSYVEAGRVANAAGAMNVEQLGAAKGVRSWAETEAWILERDTLCSS
jgi:sugar/nucleoside kinase (ribokinase family)